MSEPEYRPYDPDQIRRELEEGKQRIAEAQRQATPEAQEARMVEQILGEMQQLGNIAIAQELARLRMRVAALERNTLYVTPIR